MKHTLALLLILFSASSHGEIYRWVDDHGHSHFSDQKPATNNAEEVTVKPNIYSSIPVDDSAFSSGNKVVMYSTAWCGYCKKARAYFSASNIPYTEYDIEKNFYAKRRFKLFGGTGTPVIFVGKKRLNGFSVKRFEQIYEEQ
jgi:glutaredoxin